MRICMLSTDFPPNIGGIAAHVYELSKALVKLGNDVQVITLRRGFHDKKYQEIEGIKVYRLYYPRIRIIGFFIYLFNVWPRLKRLVLGKKLGIIHAHTILNDSLTAKSIGNIAKVQTEHTSGFLEAMEKKKHKRRNKWLLGHADHVICPSQELMDNVIKLGISREKTSFISNGVDIDKFNPKISGRAVREKYKIGPGEKIILCSRRLELKNGVYYMIKAMPDVIKGVSGVKCLIVGDGAERTKLEEEVVALRITGQVIFAGSIPNTEMPEYYAASSIVVLPSLKEATSISGLEAMASGKPLVGTTVGGIPQIITNNKTGILVPPGNPKALASAIVCLLKDEKKRTAMGLDARKIAENKFSWQIIARQTENIYYKVIQIKGQ